MKTILRLSVVAALATLLGACSSHPAGISLAEWQALSPKEKKAYHRRELEQHRQDMQSMEAFSLALGPKREDR